MPKQPCDHASIIFRIDTLGASCLFPPSSTPVLGSMSCSESHLAMASRSYVMPVAVTMTGSRMHSLVIGQQNSLLLPPPLFLLRCACSPCLTLLRFVVADSLSSIAINSASATNARRSFSTNSSRSHCTVCCRVASSLSNVHGSLSAVVDCSRAAAGVRKQLHALHMTILARRNPPGAAPNHARARTQSQAR